MSGSDWYLIDEGDDGLLSSASSFVPLESIPETASNLLLQQRKVSNMSPPAAIAKKPRYEDEIVDLISDSSSSDDEYVSSSRITARSVTVRPLKPLNEYHLNKNHSSAAEASHKDYDNEPSYRDKENIVNDIEIPRMSLAQRLLAKASSIQSSQQSVSSAASCTIKATDTNAVSIISKVNTSKSTNSKSSIRSDPTLLPTILPVEVPTVVSASVPSSQASHTTTGINLMHPIVVNSFCPSHDPSKHGRAIVDLSEEIEQTQPLSYSQSQSQEESQSSAVALSDDSSHRTLTNEQLLSWEVVLIVDQREQQYHFFQAKMLVSNCFKPRVFIYEFG